jgi:hypothetical protein
MPKEDRCEHLMVLCRAAKKREQVDHHNAVSRKKRAEKAQLRAEMNRGERSLSERITTCPHGKSPQYKCAPCKRKRDKEWSERFEAKQATPQPESGSNNPFSLALAQATEAAPKQQD